LENMREQERLEKQAKMPFARCARDAAAAADAGPKPRTFMGAVINQDNPHKVPEHQLTANQQAIQAAATQAEKDQIRLQQQFQIEARKYEIRAAQKIGQEDHNFLKRFPAGHRPMQMCKLLHIHGHCKRGEGCTFGHTYDELHPASEELQKLYAEGSDLLGPAILAELEMASQLNAKPPMQMKKKRDLCKRLAGSGCLLNERCMYAHSEADLGTVTMVIAEERVKRVLCKHFKNGRCGYGKWCVNAHSMEEIGLMKPPESMLPPQN